MTGNEGPLEILLYAIFLAVVIRPFQRWSDKHWAERRKRYDEEDRLVKERQEEV